MLLPGSWVVAVWPRPSAAVPSSEAGPISGPTVLQGYSRPRAGGSAGIRSQPSPSGLEGRGRVPGHSHPGRGRLQGQGPPALRQGAAPAGVSLGLGGWGPGGREGPGGLGHEPALIRLPVLRRMSLSSP